MDNRPNIKSVAELAGVSISTVSRVLNQSASVSDELREKVMRAISETGYSISPIASSLKTTRRNQMAIVIPSLRQTYYTDIIKESVISVMSGAYCRLFLSHQASR